MSIYVRLYHSLMEFCFQRIQILPPRICVNAKHEKKLLQEHGSTSGASTHVHLKLSGRINAKAGCGNRLAGGHPGEETG
jgi:hypothetical protein